MLRRGTLLLGELIRFALFLEARYRELSVRELWTRATGLAWRAPADADVERRVAIELAFELWAAAARATADPGLPIAFGATTRAEDLGLVGLLALTAPSGEEAVARVFRYHLLTTDSARWSIERQRGRVVMRWHRAGERTLGHRLANETVLAEAVAVGREVLCDPTLLAVRFRHPAPVDTRAHDRFFATRVEWGADHDELHITAGAFAAAPPRAHSGLAAWLVAEAERRMAVASDGSVVGRVRAAIDGAMADGEPTLRRIGAELGTSERTLRRRLDAERTTFRKLLDEQRRTRARELLTANRRMTEVAFALGFSEPSAFARAYRRWFGRAPAGDRVTDRTPSR